VALILTETEQALRVEVRFDPLVIDIENLACPRFSKIAALLRIAAFCAREASGQSHIAVAEQGAAASARFLRGDLSGCAHACQSSIGSPQGLADGTNAGGLDIREKCRVCRLRSDRPCSLACVSRMSNAEMLPAGPPVQCYSSCFKPIFGGSARELDRTCSAMPAVVASVPRRSDQREPERLPCRAIPDGD
jgi:hypothetical protein